jgi:adenylate cyclase
MERKLAAIFSTDVKGYSRLMGDDEEATIHTLKTYREVIASLIEQHHGRVVDSPGDNLLAEFASAVDAVKSAVTIQQELKTRNAEFEAHRKMEFRIGLNVGDVISDEGRLYGDGVNIAARLEGLAIPGGICLSGTVYDQIANKLDLPCTYQGEQAVKNIARPVRVYQVELDATAAPPPPSAELPAELPLPDKPSIAVLPFTNMSNDPEQEYFSDGMTEDIITDLSKIAELFVIARNSVFTYKGQAVDISDVGRKLGVRYVLEGSVRKAGNRVRITAQLIEAATQGHLWAERYDRELDDIFTLQDEMTHEIVGALKVTLAPEESARGPRIPTNNLEAYDAFLRGADAQRRFTQASMAEARQHLEHAISLDPSYAEAYASLSWVLFQEWEAGWSAEPEQAYARVQEACHKAVELDDSLAWAWAMRGWAALWESEYAQAIADVEQAVRLAPNSAAAQWLYGNVLRMVGRPDEALAPLERAMRLDPQYPAIYLFSVGETYRVLRRYPEAIATLKRCLSRAPEMELAYRFLAVAYTERGQEEEARDAAQQVLRLNPAFSVDTQRRMPYKDPAERARYIDGLRRAGLP